jgi:adenylate cyclase
MGAGAITTRIPAVAGRDERRALLRTVEKRVTITQWLAHLVGILDVGLLLFYVLPDPAAGVSFEDHIDPNLIAMAIYLPFAMAAGTIIGKRLNPARQGWLQEGREPTPEERTWTLKAVNYCFKMDAGLWLAGILICTIVNLTIDWHLAAHVAWTGFLGGVTTCTIAHLLLERELAPVNKLALAYGPPSRPAWPGVQGRLVLAWLLTTGGGLLGLITVGVDGLIHHVPSDDLARSVAVLGAGSFCVGAGVMFVVARGVTVPLDRLRTAIGRVEGGDLSAEVLVSDGSEVGLLQSGFNQMVGGLRERDRMQDLYSRQVGADVAREALAAEPRLGGTRREVAVLFVDIVGSTTLATEVAPERVVARLNRFFAVVVEVVGEHDGFVNKFEGDAALCVFGAPVEHEDPAGCALAAGRELQARLARDVPELKAGIGLSAGPAVAGWIGALQRFEYTVIGDPVNTASRVSELAKGRPDRLLATESIVRRAGAEEQARWTAAGTEILRGRSTPTRLLSAP